MDKATKTNKEEWLDSILSDAGYLLHAPTPSGIYEQTMARLHRTPPAKYALPYPKLWAAAALLLLVVNISTIVYASYRTPRQNLALATQGAPLWNMETTYNY